jgi:hypothetical protein
MRDILGGPPVGFFLWSSHFRRRELFPPLCVVVVSSSLSLSLSSSHSLARSILAFSPLFLSFGSPLSLRFVKSCLQFFFMLMTAGSSLSSLASRQWAFTFPDCFTHVLCNHFQQVSNRQFTSLCTGASLRYIYPFRALLVDFDRPALIGLWSLFPALFSAKSWRLWQQFSLVVRAVCELLQWPVPLFFSCSQFCWCACTEPWPGLTMADGAAHMQRSMEAAMP